MTEFFNQEKSKEIRRSLRRNSPITESLLWSKLRNNQLGIKFKRQFSIGRYVVDFYCPRKKLVIEIDGDSHFNKEARQNDSERENYIKALKISFLRFTNDEIMQNTNGVLEIICNTLKTADDNDKPHPNPLLRKERDNTENSSI